MFRKVGIAAVVAGAGLVLLHMTGLSSYTATAVAKVRQSFKKSVPIEFEIERLRHEVSQLMPEMKKNFRAIAEETVAVRNLNKEINTTTANLAKQKETLLAMARDLESNKTTRTAYGNHSVSPERMKAKLARDWASYQTCEAELKTKEQLLEAKESSLEAARQRLSEVKTQKQQLELEIARLDAELKTVRLAQSRCKFHFDDSQLARCKAALAEIRNRLDSEREEARLEGEFGDPAATAQPTVQPTGDLIKEIRARLGNSTVEETKSVADNID